MDTGHTVRLPALRAGPSEVGKGRAMRPRHERQSESLSEARDRRGDTGSFAFAGSVRFSQSGARPQSFSSTLRIAATMRSTPGR